MLPRISRFLTHYPRPLYFDPKWYLETYDDVAATGMDPLYHYQRHGRAEGRLPAFMVSVGRERDLRWGLAQTPDGGLERLALGQVPDQTKADRVWASLALARAAARVQDWPAAARWLDPLDAQTDLITGFCLIDPSLVAIETWIQVGQLDRAQAQLDRAKRAFGACPDLILAEANLAAAKIDTTADVAAQDAGWGAWSRVLAKLYRRHGLSDVGLGPRSLNVATDMPAFDRLEAGQIEAGLASSSFGALRARLWSSLRMSEKEPLVSVIMPARDAEATIATALRSLSAQTWASLEILVVDNASRDETAAIVRRIAQDDPRIRLLDGHAAPGAYGARNLGMAAAQGRFLTVMDADDWAHPDRIAQQARALLAAPPHVVATMTSWVRTTPELTFTQWWKEQGLIHPDISSLMLRAEVLETLGYWDLVRGGADSEYVARLEAVYGTAALQPVLPQVPLSFGRVLPGSLSHGGKLHISSHMFGPRRRYSEAAARWHGHMHQNGDLPLPAQPKVRPFAVPSVRLPDHAPDAPMDGEDTELLDTAWYLQTYSDLRASPIDPVVHYTTTGEREGRSPGPGFAPSAYALAYDVPEGAILEHYRTQGLAKGYDPKPRFPGSRPAPDATRHLLFFGHQARREVFGAERALLDMLEIAAEAGIATSVVMPQIESRPYLEALQARCRCVYVCPYGWRYGDVAPPESTVRALTALIGDVGATEVHQNTSVLEAPLRAAQRACVPAVIHVHELPASDPGLCQGLGMTAAELRAALLSEDARFVVNSAPVQDWLDAPSQRVRLAPNQIDPSLLQLPFAPQDVLRVGLIGSLVAKKGVAHIVTVARQAAQQGLPLRFVLIGPMTPDLTELGTLPDTMTHAGYVPDPAAAIAQCDIVLSLSLISESFGRTVLEAMAAGRPVICYDRGLPPTLVGRDQRAGYVVPADDPAAVTAALRGLVQDRAKLLPMSQEARMRAQTYLTKARATARQALDP